MEVTQDKIYYRHIYQIADHFGKSLECIKYHIKYNGLPDPRIQPVDPDTLVWPKPKARGARLNVDKKRPIGDKTEHVLNNRYITIAEIVDQINSLSEKINKIETTLASMGYTMVVSKEN